MDFTEAYDDRCSSVGHAAKTGDEELLARLIGSGSNVDIRDNRGWTPLHEAAAHNHIGCVQQLLQCIDKDDVNCRTFEGETALWLACLKGYHGIVITLVEAGADPNISNNEEGSPLLQAVRGDYKKCIDILLQHSANIHCQFCNGWSLMHEVACLGNSTMASHLLDMGASLDLADDFGIKPVFTAAQYGRAECLRLLLERGGDANSQAFDKATPLYLAAQEDYPECIKILLSHHGDANHETEDGLNPLHAAAHKGNVRCVRLLYDHTTIKLLSGPYTPLHFACAQGHVEVIKYLLAQGCDVNTGLKTPESEQSNVEHIQPEAPLIDALENQQLNVVKCLLANHAKTECMEMICPLKTAFPDQELLRVLLQHGCDVNCGHISKDPEFICETQDLEAIRFLLRCGMELDLSCLYDSDGCCLANLTAANANFMAMLVRLGAEYTDNLHACMHLMIKLFNSEHWEAIKNRIENPCSLQHLSRVTIRRLLGPQRLLHSDNITDLPITHVMKDYLLHI